jgi:hypothetical protein
MPYFTFKDGSYKTDNPDSLDYRLMNYINRKADKVIKATDLKSAINALISNYLKQHPNDSSKSRLIYKAIQHNFKIVATASDPGIKMPQQFYRLGQMALNLESIIKQVLNEDADDLKIKDKNYSYDDADAFPFIKDQHSNSIILSKSRDMETHYRMIIDFIEHPDYFKRNSLTIITDPKFRIELANAYKAYQSTAVYIDDVAQNQFIPGRIWKNSKIISFWQNIKTVLPHIDFIIKTLNLTDDWIIDFSSATKSGQKYMTIKQFLAIKKFTNVEKSKEEMEVARHQHLLPQLKQLSPAKGMFKDTPQKAGFGNDAEFHNANIVGDSVNN